MDGCERDMIKERTKNGEKRWNGYIISTRDNKKCPSQASFVAVM